MCRYRKITGGPTTPPPEQSQNYLMLLGYHRPASETSHQLEVSELSFGTPLANALDPRMLCAFVRFQIDPVTRKSPEFSIRSEKHPAVYDDSTAGLHVWFAYATKTVNNKNPRHTEFTKLHIC